jgi:hypothetical protein
MPVLVAPALLLLHLVEPSLVEVVEEIEPFPLPDLFLPLADLEVVALAAITTIPLIRGAVVVNQDKIMVQVVEEEAQLPASLAEMVFKV